jgi:hypothetical protein
MQFGRVYGLGLIILGIILCVFQFVVPYMAPSNTVDAEQTQTRRETRADHVRSSLPGIVGTAALVAGIALLATARRKDEPESKYKVK